MTPPLARRLHRAAPRCARTRRPIHAPGEHAGLSAQLRVGLATSARLLADNYQSHLRHPVAEILLHGVDPDDQDATMRSWSALHWAAKRGQWGGAKILLARGADPDIEDDTGCTPLHVSARRNDCTCTDQLLRADADLHRRNDAGNTPLHEAAGYGNAGAVALLLAAGADPNATAANGNAPLHEAATGGPPWYFLGHARSIAFLLDAGADPARRNHRGEEPFDTAIDAGEAELAMQLQHRGQTADSS